MNLGASGNIFIERAHPAYPLVADFLVSCCEPVSRTVHMEEYRLDSASLSAATAEGTYTLDMIDVLLRHFRLNAAQELPIDLTRCAALVQLATALDEAAAMGDDDNEGGGAISKALWSSGGSASASASGESAINCGGASHRPSLPPSLAGADFSGTVLAALYPAMHHGSDATAQTSAPLVSPPHAPSDGVKEEKKDTSSYGAAAAAVSRPAPAAAPRRVLQLFRPPSASPPPPPLPPSSSSSAASPTSSGKALISVAVTRPDDVAAPLPATVALMLLEERSASRVHIVLQPRLRRFHGFESSSNGNSSSSGGRRQRPGGASSGSGGRGGGEGEAEELFYFIESRQRAHLEMVLDELKEFLEPVLLYGKERWILSDVDRSPVSAGAGVDVGIGGAALRRVAAQDGGRPAVLRLLYQPLTTSGAVSRSSFPAAATSPAAASRFVFKCQVRDGKLREVKERLFSRFNIRADCYYDYPQDRTLHVPNLNLASHVRLRPYQVDSLERFRRSNKAHQGVVVLPCGAGKTLTGIGAAATMHKTTIVMCVNNMSVFQWQREFLRWTDLTEEEVTVCTAKVKQMPGKVFITTYSMVIAKRGAGGGVASEESRAILQAMTSQPWGLLLLDEVHTALAHHFQEVLNTIKYKCVLGLSATLLREDDKIGDLRHLVGPKLYEANWLDLTRAGFLANVECAEVQCPMPLPFLQAYRDVLRARLVLGAGKDVWRKRRRRGSVFDDGSDDDGNGKESGVDAAAKGGRGTRLNTRALRLASCNPYKLWCTQALLAFHQQRSPPDKVIIFCDYLADVRFFAHHLHLPFMDQRTSEAERTNLLQYFQHSTEVNAIILTRVGDVALDLPCASVIIQVSGLGASRRQEAQRLGRILRPKPPSLDNTCAYFYTLVSQDTGDIRTSYKRQSWLRDQGFAYRILHSDRVLSEFVRVGGRPCCVGAPQWWYQWSGALSDASERAAAAAPLPSTAVFHDGVYWAPFSAAASLQVEGAFQKGFDACTLKSSDLGSDTPRPSAASLGNYPLHSAESWAITFSSADAPQTFGTVRIGEGGGEAAMRVRRVRRGCLDASHRCAAAAEKEGCLDFALQQLLRVLGAEGTSAPEGVGGKGAFFDSDDDAYGEEED